MQRYDFFVNLHPSVDAILTKKRVSNKSVGTLLLLRSCITRANFRLAKLEKAEFT